MKKLSIALVVALLCGAVAMVGTAGARGKAATTVTIKFNGDGFQGKVKSSKSKCVKNRTVKVFHKRVPTGHHLSLKAKTDQVGRWAIDADNAHGRFYARVARVVKHRADGTKVVCDTDRSATHRY